MKFSKLTLTASMLLLLGAAAPVFAQAADGDRSDRHDAREDQKTREQERDRREADHKQQRIAEAQRQKQIAADQKQQQRAEKEKQKQIREEQRQQARRDKDQRQRHHAADEQQRREADNERQRQHAADERQRELAEQQREHRADADEHREARMQHHPERSDEQSREWQRRHDWDRNGGWQRHDSWNEHRSERWDYDHRTWAQRGGYGGFYIPQAVFSLNFGSDHFFRIEARPTIYQGHPRFNYRGTSFVMVDPYPASWGENWTDNDEVYVDYDDGYYLHNRKHPGVAIAVNIEE